MEGVACLLLPGTAYNINNAPENKVENNHISVHTMKEYKNFSSVPLKEGQQDTERTRMERWEEANGILLKSLPLKEWVEVVSRMLCMTERECEQWWWHMGGGLEGGQQHSNPTMAEEETQPVNTSHSPTEYNDELECSSKGKVGETDDKQCSNKEMFVTGLFIACFHIEAGSRKFVDYAEMMLTDVGEYISPYLKAFYNAIRDMPEMSQFVKDMDTYHTVCGMDIHAIKIYMDEGYGREELRNIPLPLSHDDYCDLKALRTKSRAAYYHLTHGHEFDALRTEVYDRIEREVMKNWPASKYSREDLLNMKMPISDEVYQDLKTLEERDESSFYWLTHGNALRNMRMYVLNRMGEDEVGK